MFLRLKLLVLVGFLASFSSFAAEFLRTPASQADAEARLKRDVTFLASPLCEGRGVTTKGIDIAADYIAAEFKKLGLTPGFKNSYFQPFPIRGAVAKLTISGNGRTLELKEGFHFNALGYDQSGAVEGELVFAGFGVSTKTPEYDDYAGLDVKGKVVVVIRDTPRANATDRSTEMVAAAAFVSKINLAKTKGAAAILIVNDQATDKDSEMPTDFRFTRLARGKGENHLLALSLRRSVLESLLSGPQTLSAIEKEIDRTMKPNSFPLKGYQAKLSVENKPDGIPAKNVIGVLEGSGPLAKETIVVGAHYDHLGYGGPSSLAKSKKSEIHHGADDNASGTTAMMELARRMAGIKNRQGRRIVFMAFSGEELGLFGSAYYCKNPVFPLADTAAMLNLDMVGRLTKDKDSKMDILLTQGHGSAEPFKKLIDDQAVKHNFKLKSQASGQGPSDHSSFYSVKVPCLFLWTNTHPDYHRPSDTADKINLEGMRRIVEMSEEILHTFATMPKPTFIAVKGEPTPRPSKGGPRLGIRPGYSEDKKGVEVEGVVEGGAAEKGGIKAGDQIIKIGDAEIADLPTYMKVMATQQPKTTIEILVIRDKKEVKLKVPLE
jgi:hypothetical protein